MATWRSAMRETVVFSRIISSFITYLCQYEALIFRLLPFDFTICLKLSGSDPLTVTSAQGCNFWKLIGGAERGKDDQGTIKILMGTDFTSYLVHFLHNIGGAQLNIGGAQALSQRYKVTPMLAPEERYERLLFVLLRNYVFCTQTMLVAHLRMTSHEMLTPEVE